MNLPSTKLGCFAALCAIAAAPAARAAVDAHSYVQKGLVACYDGIDNAGTGVHDSTAATWADLSGNGFDGTLAANLGWAADGWTNAVDGSGVRVSEWFNQDGLDIVVLSAAPFQYYAFDGWTGDTDAIADGSADGPTVRVDTTRPVSLVANFVRLFAPPTVIVVQ